MTRGFAPLSVSSKLFLSVYTTVSLDDIVEVCERAPLCPLLLLFISLFMFINCLLINARWCIHFGLYIISMYLVLVPLFKYHMGLVYVCLFFR